MSRFPEKTLAKKKIIQTLTHEIRSPLFNIKSFLETLYEYHFQLNDSQVLEFLEIANQETNRLVRLTNQSLQLSRVNFSIETMFRLLNIEDIINKVSRSYKITALIKRINLYYKVKPNNSKAMGNYDLIFQILINLITNSIKFTYPNGIVLVKLKNISSISTKKRKKTVSLRVEVLDTGIGLHPKKKTNSFKFNHSRNSLGNQVKGTGLGLDIVREILSMHNTSLTIMSNLNRGTSAFFKL